MKTTKSLYYALLVCGSLAACQGTDKSENEFQDSSSLGKRADSSTAATPADPKNETFEAKVNDDSKAFIEAAAMGSSMEIELGKYAMQNSENKKVKEFASKMVADHTLAKSDLIKLGQSSGILLPTDYPADVKAHMTDMMKLKGAAFDKHYADMMVNDHAKTITLFKAAESLRDDPVKDFATKTLPILQTHQTLANELAASLK